MLYIKISRFLRRIVLSNFTIYSYMSRVAIMFNDSELFEQTNNTPLTEGLM